MSNYFSTQQFISSKKLEEKLAMIDVLALMQEMPLCDPQACRAYLEGRCQITGNKTDETKICIPERQSVER
jgi:hypothetical protein